MNNLDDILFKKLWFLRGNFNFDFLFDKDCFSKSDLRDYYIKNKYLLYRWASGSKDGFMHMGLSDNGKREKGKHYQTYQVEKIDEIIKENNFKNVLELGCGQGANACYLASRNKDVKFFALDLYINIEKKKRLNNISYLEGDYHDLSQFKDNSMDLIYGIETVCYSTDKDKIFKEVNRVLKKDGLFILFDGYLNKEKKDMSYVELTICKLVENGFYMDEFEHIGNIQKYIDNNNFEILKEENMKEKLINHLYNYQEKINHAIKHKVLFRLGAKLVPNVVLGNLLPIYFMADTIDFNLSVYYYHILRKIR
jgi:ubiquinone/menaquinone biosynthesis C-methylase UbiE